MQTQICFFLANEKNDRKIVLKSDAFIQNKLVFNFLQSKTVVKPIAQNLWIEKFSFNAVKYILGIGIHVNNGRNTKK